jgi:glycosyltransferase involved in cell wall biosynthesis
MFPELQHKLKHISIGLLFLDIPEKNKSDARLALRWHEQDKIVLFWGNIEPYKGLDNLLSAFDYLKRSQESNIHLFIVGQWNIRGAMKYNMLANIHENRSITLINHYVSSEVARDLLCASDLLVLPYKTATQSAAGLSALRYGTPLIVTNTGSLPELLPTELREWIIPPASPIEIANKIVRFFSLSSEQHCEISKKIVEHGIKNYSWGSIADRFMTIYNQCSTHVVTKATKNINAA